LMPCLLRSSAEPNSILAFPYTLVYNPISIAIAQWRPGVPTSRRSIIPRPPSPTLPDVPPTPGTPPPKNHESLKDFPGNFQSAKNASPIFTNRSAESSKPTNTLKNVALRRKTSHP
jgi:hypothetical protein